MKRSKTVVTLCAGALFAMWTAEAYAQNITQVMLRVKTSSNSSSLGISGAETDGDVYLGFAGREFALDTAINDFGAGSDVTYIFGISANVLNAGGNDPRSPQLTFSQALAFPVYLRLSDRIDDDWAVDVVEIQILSGNTRAHFSWAALGTVNDDMRVRLGRRSGAQLYLTKTD